MHKTKKTHKRNKNKKRSLLYQAAVGILFLTAIGCVIFLYRSYREYQEGIRIYTSIRSQITVQKPEDTGRQVQIADQMRTMGENVRAWIYCPDTPIDYPVMQASDNQYYLTHLPDGTRNGCGSIFLDHANAPDFSDDNSILYGHHMNNGTMFASIDSYREPSYYRAHPLMYLYTKERTWKVEIFAGYVLDGHASLPMQFEEGKKNEFITSIKERSDFHSDVVVQEADRLLTMVTCDYSWKNARYALYGRLVPLED